MDVRRYNNVNREGFDRKLYKSLALRKRPLVVRWSLTSETVCFMQGKDNTRDIMYALSPFATKIKNLTVVYEGGAFQAADVIMYLTNLLGRGVQLTRFEFQAINMNKEHSPQRQDLIMSLACFLKTQYAIEEVSFKGLFLKCSESLDIMESLGSNCAMTKLKHLQLHNFFQIIKNDDFNTSIISRFVSVIRKLWRLEVLSIDHYLLSSEFVMALAGAVNGNFKNLVLLSYNEISFQNIEVSFDAWEKLIAACPQMMMTFKPVGRLRDPKAREESEAPHHPRSIITNLTNRD